MNYFPLPACGEEGKTSRVREAGRGYWRAGGATSHFDGESKMVMICRIVWANKYDSLKEEFFAGNFKHPKRTREAHEMLNFANIGGWVYGYVESMGARISLSNLRKNKSSEVVHGVTVIWCALDPVHKSLHVVGWYENASVFSEPQKPTKNLRRKEITYFFKAKSEDAHLISPADRFLLVPTKTRRTDRGFIGQRNWFFPERYPNYKKFLESFALLASGEPISPKHPIPFDDVTFEEGQRTYAEISLTARNPRLVDAAKKSYGLECQVCRLNFEDRYGAIGKGFIEVHHLVPLSRRKRYSATVNDVRVLCANCHRMVHRRVPPFTIDELKQRYRPSPSPHKVS